MPPAPCWWRGRETGRAGEGRPVGDHGTRAVFGYDSVRPYDTTAGEMLAKLPAAAPPFVTFASDGKCFFTAESEKVWRV